jgi:hypothetical protein
MASALAVPAALATTQPAAITPSSIAGAKLGLGKVAYLKLLGRPVRFQAAGGGNPTEGGFQQPSNYSRLLFAKRGMYVYFQDGVPGAVEITTWNKAYRTAEGVGPCSTLAQVKAAYGSRLGRDPGSIVVKGGKTFGYIVGRSLIFSFPDSGAHPLVPSEYVTAVALYDGSKPGWDKPQGPERFASFVSGNVGAFRCQP